MGLGSPIESGSAKSFEQMHGGSDARNPGLAGLLHHMSVLESVSAISDMKPADAARVVEKAEPLDAAKMLLGIKDEQIAIAIFKEIDPVAAARIIPKIGVTRPIAKALDAMPSKEAGRILTHLAETRPRLAASILEARLPAERASTFKALDPKLASDLWKDLRPQVRSNIADRWSASQNAALMERAGSPARTAETLLGMKDTHAAVATFKKLNTEMQIQVLTEVGSKASALALNDMRSRQAARLLTGLAETRPDLAARKLEAMDSKARAGAVKALEQKVATELLDQMKSQVAGDIATRLPSRTSAELLNSSTNTDEIMAHIQADIALRLTERIAQVKAKVVDKKTVQAEARAQLLEARVREEIGKILIPLSSTELADALRQTELSEMGAKILLKIGDSQRAADAFGRLKPDEAARLIPAAGAKATALAFERLSAKWVAQTLEELVKTMPELGTRTLGAMHGDARIVALKEMPSHVAVVIWERMSMKDAVWVAESLPITKIAAMAEQINPERGADIARHLDGTTRTTMLANMAKIEIEATKQPPDVKKNIKLAMGIVVTTPIATTIGLIPTFHSDGFANFYSLLASSAVATAVCGNIYFRVRDHVKIGDKSLGERPNLSQIANQSSYALIALATQYIGSSIQ